MNTCIFCEIVSGSSPAHVIWEDDKYIAFLSIFPNTEGFSVVIPKEHYPSYLFDLPEEVFSDLTLAAKKVGKLIDSSFEDVGRTGLIMEGFGVDHAHIKLFPMHGTKDSEWKKRSSNVNKYFENYEGYISSHDFKREDDERLKKTADKIKSKK